MGEKDIAQAALFAAILTAEVATLRAQLRKAEQQWDERRGRSQGDVDTPARLVRLREQLDEAKRLSALLRKVPNKLGPVAHEGRQPRDSSGHGGGRGL
jgi:hypothetical protein